MGIFSIDHRAISRPQPAPHHRRNGSEEHRNFPEKRRRLTEHFLFRRSKFTDRTDVRSQREPAADGISTHAASAGRSAVEGVPYGTRPAHAIRSDNAE